MISNKIIFLSKNLTNFNNKITFKLKGSIKRYSIVMNNAVNVVLNIEKCLFKSEYLTVHKCLDHIGCIVLFIS